MEKLKMGEDFSAPVEKLYNAWINSEEHSQFTGAGAEIDPVIGGKFTAWDGYISGVTLELDPPKRILQHWRTTEFPEDAPDSLLEILFQPVTGGTKITLVHTEIPDGQAQSYREGWEDYYFTPMKEYFKQQFSLHPTDS
jgi:activator of HSP90 ATPase